jgi:hypothetical protein
MNINTGCNNSNPDNKTNNNSIKDILEGLGEDLSRGLNNRGTTFSNTQKMMVNTKKSRRDKEDNL